MRGFSCEYGGRRDTSTLFFRGQCNTWFIIFVYSKLDLSICWVARLRPVFILFTPLNQIPMALSTKTLISSPSAMTCQISDSRVFWCANTKLESCFWNVTIVTIPEMLGSTWWKSWGQVILAEAGILLMRVRRETEFPFWSLIIFLRSWNPPIEKAASSPKNCKWLKRILALNSGVGDHQLAE